MQTRAVLSQRRNQRKKWSLWSLLAVACASAAVGAGTVRETAATELSAAAGSAARRADAVTAVRQSFDREIRPLFERSCFACHDSSAKPEGLLGHLPGIRAHEWKHIRDASRILDFKQEFPNWASQPGADPVFFLNQIRAVIEKDEMPPKDFKFVHQHDGRLLTDAEKNTVVSWVDESKKRIAAADASAKPSAGKILSQNCLGCHGDKTGFGGLVFRIDQNGAVSVGSGKSTSGIPFFTAGDPESSAIYLVLLTDPAQRKGLPSMPQGGTPLTAQDRDVIFDWIKQQH